MWIVRPGGAGQVLQAEANEKVDGGGCHQERGIEPGEAGEEEDICQQ